MQDMAQNEDNSDEHINRQIFGEDGNLYRGSPSRCSTISIPIHHMNHFFLCKVDFEEKKIVIYDTLRSWETDQQRLLMVEKAVRVTLKLT